IAEVEERSGGKARGGKLARRARSFKEDFLEKLSHMRSPGSGSGGGGGGGGGGGSGAATRAASPSSPRTPRDKNASGCNDSGTTLDKNPLRDLHIHVRQVQLALLHFRDVVSKKKLEMLPGNGTIVLDTITTIHNALKSYLLYENSSTLGSATNQVYQALAQLLKLCDDVLLHGDQSSALDTENVTHVIGLVEEAVKNLVALAHEKIANKQKPTSVANNNRTSGYGSELTQRNSLPDIPLTPRERQILEQTAASSSLVRSSHSSESILRDSSPPPKPPLPDRTNICLSEENSSSGTPPPLPPKRRTRTQQLLDESEGLLASSLDRVSLRSRSPEDSSSLLSASAGSLDSALNHSRDEDEIRAIMGPNDESLNDSMDLSLMATIQGMQVNGNSNCNCWDGSESSIPSTMLLGQQTPQEMLSGKRKCEIYNCASVSEIVSGTSCVGVEGKMERLSTQTQESGFVSMHSQRSSSQSYTTGSSMTSKRSSQQSSVSYNSQSFSSQQQSFSQSKLSSDSNGSIFTQKTMTSSKSTISTTNTSGNGDPALLEKLEMESTVASDTNGTNVPPALPEKRSRRRKERQPSQYDNVPENEHLSTCTLHTSNGDSPDTNKPPPLPLKKRHIMAYMEMFGNCSHSNNDFISGLGTRHSVAAYNSMQAEWQQHEMSLTTTQSCSFMAHTITALRDSSRISDLDDVLLQTLMEFVQQLVCSGDLTMAKALRVKILEKHTMKQLQATQPILSSLSVTTKQASLLDFKSEQIAEQMTLLDADLFMKIEIPEVLIWAQEQNEERSPNLTRFTEHFNKMSYWARSRILEHRLENEAKDREKYVVKFIKIMKHLRKINNFNSYLALLSALDSAPIRRLEWQKHITEGLKEYCALIDSSSSFRAYRQALAETQPPCIPYIGLVLQDLTFVHIGNSDLLPDGTINFSKRWQQFNIVENMKRFKKGMYSFKKHERIITFFNNFSDFLCEEAMWQISESIKPRGGKKAQPQN
ncbi:Guanine nucleotide-releasing factor, partial [Ooceraea biroi]